MWLMMFLVCVHDLSGTEYARNMAKLAKTLQQTINEDVRHAVFCVHSVDSNYMLLQYTDSVKNHCYCTLVHYDFTFKPWHFEIACLLVRCIELLFSAVVYVPVVNVLLFI